MRGSLRTLFLATAALGAAVALFVALTLPPASVAIGAGIPSTFAAGAYHIHSNRSDGTGTVDEIAAAAARAGLAFAILTDHGDATRAPDPPAYRSGVLVIDAVEINTASGHVVALGLSGPAPYPLAGSASDVIEDIHRLGGYAVLAHPDSPKETLRWRGGATAPFDGIEWINADSEWRDERSRRLLTTASRAMLRGPESIASLFSPPLRSLARWDQASRFRPAPVFGLAALDAHANIPWREDEEPRQPRALAWPSYETMFKTLVQTVALDAPLSGDAAADAKRVLDAIVHGRSFGVVRAFAYPAALSFSADVNGGTVAMGERTSATGAATFRAVVTGAPGVRVTLLRNGQPIGTGAGKIETTETAPDGAYRVQAEWPGQAAPWIVSNQIVFGSGAGRGLPPPTSSPEPTGWIDLRSDDHPWAVERAPDSGAIALQSVGTLAIDDGAMRLDYRLGEGTPRGQYAALVGLVGVDAGVDRVTFTARADRPTRVSLQVKVPRGNARWRRSVYLDQTAREVTVLIAELEPADVVTSLRPNVTPLRSVLFVLDTLNSATGSTGTIWISKVALGTREP